MLIRGRVSLSKHPYVTEPQPHTPLLQGSPELIWASLWVGESMARGSTELNKQVFVWSLGPCFRRFLVRPLEDTFTETHTIPQEHRQHTPASLLQGTY